MQKRASMAAGLSLFVHQLAHATVYQSTATHYNAAQGGGGICYGEGGYCGAPSDAALFWEGDICNCGSSDFTCQSGWCLDCTGRNECQKACPSCSKDMCGNRYKITCVDPDGRGYCRSQNACVVMTVTNACPQYNPCNTCKGDANPCQPGRNHIDLCDQTFDAIAYRNKQPAEGIQIQVEKTDLPEGPCGGNNDFHENVLYDRETSKYWDMLSQMTYYEYATPGSGENLFEVCRKVPNRQDAILPGFVLMSMADVWKHFDYCDIGEWDVVALADGKYIGYGYNFIMDQRTIPGNYLGCSKGEALIMTKNVEIAPQVLDWSQPCPEH